MRKTDFKPMLTCLYKNLLCLCISLLCLLFTYVITISALFPASLYMEKGSEQKFSFSIPVSATIEPDTIAAVKVNDTEVTDNITVTLKDPIVISAEETGQASMTLNAFGIPLKKVTVDIVPEIEVVPCGMTIGVKINTEGVMVLGTGYVNGEDGKAHMPSDGVLKSGDLILRANGKDLETKEDLISEIESADGNVDLDIKREEEIVQSSITPVKSVLDQQNKIGVWVRDSTQGIGTITYYDPATKNFGALGHGIMDVDTKQLLSVKNGEVFSSRITSVKKGKKGSPGELIGEINKNSVLGSISTNCASGIYGKVYSDSFSGSSLPIAYQNEIHEGPAVIYSNVVGNAVDEYDVFIETVNRYSSDDSKGMILRITDPDLLQKTNGIVQGMSGSPIIQDDKVIGAVTHVFVQEPTKGYGIFIENMLKNN